MGRTCLLAIVVAFTSFSSLPAQEGRLGKVREEVQDKPTPGSQSTREESRGDADSSTPGSLDPADELQTDFRRSLGMIVQATVAAPFVIPRHLIGDRGDTLDFARHPYARGYPGYLMPTALGSPETAERWSPDRPPRPWMGRLTIENGNDFDGLNRFQGQLLLDTASRFGIVTNWDHYDERLSCGCRDHATIGDVTLTYRFAQNESFLMRAGLGVRTITDEHFTDWGVNLHYGGEWFPAHPWIATGSVDFGTLGNAFVVRTRATLGVTWRGWEAFGGYDLLRIGDVNLHGPMVGVRWWF